MLIPILSFGNSGVRLMVRWMLLWILDAKAVSPLTKLAIGSSSWWREPTD
ncbi:MAG: hypothetical protein AAEJ52_17600 [Myxococcota bacterium]